MHFTVISKLVRSTLCDYFFNSVLLPPAGGIVIGREGWLLISAPRLGVYYFLSLTLSVCLSVRLSVYQKHCFFFLFSRWNRANSWPSVLHDQNYKTLFFDF